MINTPKRRALQILALVLFLVGALTFSMAAYAQMTPGDILSTPRICPFSPARTQNAIDAFAKMVPTFHNRRCENCHGAVNPFTGENHVPGKVEITEDQMQAGACNQCHSNLPPLRNGKGPVWKLPLLPEHSFVGKDALALCKMMKQSFAAFPNAGVQFEFHILNDNDRTDFQMIAFAGTRGIPGVTPEPIEGITLGQFFDQATAWVDAMGGDFQGDERCGCEPVHQAVRLAYVANISLMGVVQDAGAMGPVDIPITFHGDRTFEAQAPFPFRGAGADRGCVSGSQGQMVIKLKGDADERTPENKNKMRFDVTEVTPTTGATEVRCPVFSGGSLLRGGNLPPPHLDMLGLVGEEKKTIVPLPSQVINANLCAKIIDLDPKVKGIDPPTPPQCPKMK
jgi:hypothetical protein